MSLRTIATLAVAIFLGILAVVLLRAVVISRMGTSAPAAVAGGRPVVVAATPVARGAALQPAMFKLVTLPADSVPAGSFTSVDDLLPKGAPAKVALRDIIVNEPVLASRVSGPGARPNLAATLGPGMRAVSVKSSEVAGVGGFVLPGDRVDVLVTRVDGTGESARTVLNVLAENARVLGVDQLSDADKPTVANAVTVEVTPEQAQTISLAQAVGNVTLALRQVSDATPLARRSMTVADLGGFQRVSLRTGAPRQTKHAGPQVRVTRGVEVSGYALP